MHAKWAILGAVLLALLLLGGCILYIEDYSHAQLSRGQAIMIETTAYCPCGQCCGWRRNWLLRPVVTAGPRRGKPKAVGITASGKKAKPGMIAADTRYYPFGTVIYFPGYGYGTVEDRGGDIKGPQRIDLYYNTHSEAMHWGRQKVRAVVFPPGTPPVPKNLRPPR